MSSRKSFFERLTGSIRMDDNALREMPEEPRHFPHLDEMSYEEETYEEEEGELAVDVYLDNDAIVIKAMTSGVRKNDLDIAITRETVMIRGSRFNESDVDTDAFYYRELYWGTFSRTIILAEEIDVDAASAKEAHGLLTIHLPLIDKNREAKLTVE
jgi:HSP20 family protein